MREKARELGFDACRIVRPTSLGEAPERFDAWLRSGAAGDMTWLAEKADRRKDPRKLWSEVVSILVLAMNYGPATDPLAALAQKSCANISVYARNRDYHDLVKGRLKLLAGWLAAQRAGTDVKVFVDTAPVMEKPLAQAAGLGWQGKHTNLVSRDFGSWLFLGTIFTTLELVPDDADTDHCGSCRACLDICPTQAFPQPRVLDARRCISYLTIEHKGTIPAELRPPIGNRIYGCDDCLAVCPWNKYARRAQEAKLAARAELTLPTIAVLLGLEDAAFRRLFSGSAVKRIGIDRFTRNVLIAAGNSGDPTLAGAVAAKLASPSPLVRAMAVWALARLDPRRLETAALEFRFDERDETVEAEWAAALDRGPRPTTKDCET